MDEKLMRKCRVCGEITEDENLLVCLSCGAELPHLVEREEKKYNLFSAYGEMFKKMFDFSSRTSRSAYWYAYLMNMIISVLFTILLFGVVSYAGTSPEVTSAENILASGAVQITLFFILVYSIVLLIPQISLIVRRLHDTGRSAIFALLLFLSTIGNIILIVLLAQKGTDGPNRYGD